MITQYACNKPASWPLNIRLSAAKTRFIQSTFRMQQVMHCVVLVTFARERKRKRTTIHPYSQGHVSHYHELMSRVWPVNAYFFLSSACWGSASSNTCNLQPCQYWGFTKRMKAIDYLCIIVLWKYALSYNFGNFDLAWVADLPLLLIICRHISILVSSQCHLRDGND